MQKEVPMMRPATNADGATVRALVFEILREHGTADQCERDAIQKSVMLIH